MNNYYKVLIFILTLSISSCATRLRPSAPNPGIIPEQDFRESLISLPLNTSIPSVLNYLNANFPSGQVFYENSIPGFHRGEVRVTRNRPIGFSAHNNRLRFTIPLNINVYAAYRKNVFGVKITKTGKGEANITLFLDVTPTLQPNYQFRTTSNLTYNLSQASVRISLLGDIGRLIGDPHVTISVRDKLRPVINREIQEFTPRLNKLISQELNSLGVEEAVSELWSELGKPINLKDSSYWLEVNPKSILFENVGSTSRNLKIVAGLKAELSAVLTENPEHNQSDLPPLEIDTGIDGEFSIYLPISLNYKSMEKVLIEELKDKTYSTDDGKYSVTLKDISLYGGRHEDANILVTGVTIEGFSKVPKKKVRGILWFFIDPAYDSNNGRFYVRDLKMTPETNSVILNKLVPWLLDNFYLDDFLSNATYSVADDIREASRLLQERIRDIQFGELKVQGLLENLQTEGFIINREHIGIVVTAEGKLISTPIVIRP